jgi:uncharacterized membrane protein
MQPKHLSLILFASLGINIFLGGMWVGTLFDSKKDHHHKGHEHRALKPPGGSRPHGPFSERNGDAPRNRHEGMHEKRRGDEPGPRNGGEGPDDLVLLRHMVRIMGGPDDPRVVKLKEASREDIRTTRQAIRAAHQKVHETLAAEPFDEKALRAALTELSDKSTLARSRAQTGIVELAALMTPEERKKLREKSRPLDRGPLKNVLPQPSRSPQPPSPPKPGE